MFVKNFRPISGVGRPMWKTTMFYSRRGRKLKQQFERLMAKDEQW
jgi:hypothetical protein